MRPIDADALKIENVDLEHGCTVVDYAMAVIKSVADAPTIDAVPVVRCGQCKHWKTADDHCTHPAGLCATGKKARNNYCSIGERKDGEG